MNAMFHNTARTLVMAGAFLTLSVSTISHADEQDHELEPCINGGVSATGLYPSQAIENAALADVNLAENSDIPGTDFIPQKRDN
jgi:hypothetical protein